jgi:glycosyltransferase involved in cell wall biosynthesis
MMARDATIDATRPTSPRRAPLRVLMVTPRYLPEIGGVERHVHEVATRLAASERIAITVLTTSDEPHPRATEVAEGVEVRRVRARPAGRDWRFAPGLVPVIADGRWDVVHVQSYHTLVAPLAMVSAARRRIPYVLTFHGGGHSVRLRHLARGMQRRALRPLIKRASALVAVAQFEIDEYAAALRISPDRFVLIPNGVDLPSAGPPGLPDPAGLPDPRRGPLIASIGRLERYKGHQRVIAALPGILEREPDARLWIAGSGPYEAALRRQVSDLGIGERVEISAVAADQRGAMARRVSEVDVVALLSDFETHPIAALEAISLGRPLVVANGSGLGELAQRGLARAVDAQAEPELIAAAILRELDDPLVRPPLSLPSWDECAASLLALYERVASPTLRTGPR